MSVLKMYVVRRFIIINICTVLLEIDAVARGWRECLGSSIGFRFRVDLIGANRVNFAGLVTYRE